MGPFAQRAMAALGGFVIVSTMAISSEANPARPLRFWVVVVDLATAKMYSPIRFTKATAIPVPLAAWSCATSDVSQMSTKTTGIFQAADLTCTSGGATVSVSAECTLTSDDEFGGSTMVVGDKAGHKFELSIRCTNVEPPNH